MKPDSNVTAARRVTAASLLVALGIIYGDIGTSPLYVLKAIAGEHPISELLIYGGVSCIFWTLAIQTTFKYIVLTLMADNHGEGGIFSLYALVRRYGKGKLVIVTILGATTLLADGIITPPISVASAVEGLGLVWPQLPTIPIVIIILSLLFLFQRFGTQQVGKTFGPVMVLWFSMLFTLGLVQILGHPGILKALNPYYAVALLTQYPGGFWLLGAVFLCTTGAEALYSDLGHCGRNNIRISWIFVKTCLMVNYLGQSAWAMGQQSLMGRNPFYEIMPSWFLLPGILIATAATIIASQALISGSYTLISEAMSLNFWPRIIVRQPTELKGQIYIPSVNNILWVGCILMVLYFRNSAHMEAAYGFSITIAMMMTTIMLGYFLRFVKKWNPWLLGGLLLFFLSVESAFFIANVAKIRERWMFLFFELSIFMVMYVWYFARKTNNGFVRFVALKNYTTLLGDLGRDTDIPKYSTHLIYLTKADNPAQIEEKIIHSIFSKKPKRADVYWFLHLNHTDNPYTLEYFVEELLDARVIRVDINIGFRVQPRTELYFKKIVQELIKRHQLDLHVLSDGSTRYNPEPDFVFVVLEHFLSVENEFNIRDSLLLKTYFFLKKLGASDQKAFGLDKSDMVLEDVPLIVQSAEHVQLRYIEGKSKFQKTNS